MPIFLGQGFLGQGATLAADFIDDCTANGPSHSVVCVTGNNAMQLKTYPRTSLEASSGRESLNNRDVLGRALKTYPRTRSEVSSGRESLNNREVLGRVLKTYPRTSLEASSGRSHHIKRGQHDQTVLGRAVNADRFCPVAHFASGPLAGDVVGEHLHHGKKM